MYLSIILQTIHRSGDDLVKLDPYGAGLAIISISIVFSVLLALFLVFKFIGKVFKGDLKFNKKIQSELAVVPLTKDDPSGEVCCAIAMALYCYNNENHDYENTILTIKKQVNNYSPWNSKFYGLRKTVRL